MGSSQARRELWEEFSAHQIDLLRALRSEISSRRWKIMLEIDAVQGYLSGIEGREDDQELMHILSEVERRLEEVHRDLSRIPEDIIPPF